MDKLALIVPAAGESQRMGGERPKPLISISGKTIVERAVEPFLSISQLSNIVILCPAKSRADFAALPGLSDPRITLIAGGNSRQQSVFIGLQWLDSVMIRPENCYVTIHDAARCLVSAKLINECLGAAERDGAAVPVLPVVDSIKRVEGGKVKGSVDRSGLAVVQTPQIFKFGLIYQRHMFFARKEVWDFSDDSAMLEGVAEVRTVEGERTNIKVTTPADLSFAQAVMEARL